MPIFAQIVGSVSLTLVTECDPPDTDLVTEVLGPELPIPEGDGKRSGGTCRFARITAILKISLGNYIGCCSINLQKLTAEPRRLATTHALSRPIPIP